MKDTSPARSSVQELWNPGYAEPDESLTEQDSRNFTYMDMEQVVPGDEAAWPDYQTDENAGLMDELRRHSISVEEKFRKIFGYLH